MQITKAEFLRKYGNELVQFSSYYKYTFTFNGVLENGHRILVNIGGDADEIYRLDVCADLKESIASLDIDSGSVYDVDGNTIEFF